MKVKLISLLFALFLFQGVHTLDCPDGSGPAKKGDTSCSECSTWNCRVCEYGNCLICQENYIRGQYSRCVACPEGQYSNPRAREGLYSDGTRKECKNCADPGCRRCSGLEPGQCVSCLDGLYWDQVSKSCKACGDPYCKQCSGPGTGQCNLCYPEAYSTPENTCSLCGVGQTTETIVRATVDKCKYCQEDNCLQCFFTSKGWCSACRPGFLLVGGLESQKSCVPHQTQHCEGVSSMFLNGCVNCTVGSIMNRQTGVCTPCQDTGCAKCDNLAPLSCSSCLTGFYLKSDKSCGACEDNGCSSCRGTGQNQCLVCKQGFTLTGSVCIPCSVPNCVTCDQSQKCSACKNGYYLDVQSNQCKYCGDGSASPIGAILRSQCDICKSSADLTCSLPSSSTAAVTCKPGYGITVSTGHASWTTCMECPSNCKSCDTTDSQITDCNTCNLGYYLNEQKQCSLCQDNNCDQCSAEGIGKCTTCKSGFLLENGQCKAVCSDSNCAACSGPGPNACISCPSGYHLNNNGQCETCGTGCEICSSSGRCLSCLAGYYSNINDGTCQKCPLLQSSSAGSTSISECFNCADAQCINCNARNTGSCQVCTNGYVANPVTKTCDKCYDPQCLKCQRSGPDMSQKCTSCSLGYFPNGIACDSCADKDCTDCFGLGQGKCSTCKNGYFKTKENTCKPCEDEGCTSCSVAGTKKCSACAPDYYLQDNRCIRCNKGKSSPPDSKSIEACRTCDDQFCDTCNGEQGTGKCKACISEYYLTKSNTCQHCDDKGCLACSGSGLHQCTICAANHQRSNSSTCDPCPEGMLSKAGGFCESCGGGGCRVCNTLSLDECLNCLPGFYLKNKKCIACEGGKYPADTQFGGTSPSYCRDCDVLHCKTCSGPGTAPGICTSCKEGFTLNDVGFCVPCQDKGCKACLWTGTRQCVTCEANYYLQDNECTPCEEGKSSPAGSTKLEDCQKIQMKSSSSSSSSSGSGLIVVLGAVGVILALALAFLWKKTNIFGSKKASGTSSVNNSPANAYDQLQEVEESNSRHRIELGSLNQRNNF